MERHAAVIAPPPARREGGRMVFEQRFVWATAYRDGRQVCARVGMTILADPRIGLPAWQGRRRVEARFMKGLDPVLHDELSRLVLCRGVAGQRLAERLEPIELVFADGCGEQRLTGYLEPPVRRPGSLEEIDFRVRPVDLGDSQ